MKHPTADRHSGPLRVVDAAVGGGGAAVGHRRGQGRRSARSGHRRPAFGGSRPDVAAGVDRRLRSGQCAPDGALPGGRVGGRTDPRRPPAPAAHPRGASPPHQPGGGRPPRPVATGGGAPGGVGGAGRSSHRTAPGRAGNGGGTTPGRGGPRRRGVAGRRRAQSRSFLLRHRGPGSRRGDGGGGGVGDRRRCRPCDHLPAPKPVAGLSGAG